MTKSSCVSMVTSSQKMKVMRIISCATNKRTITLWGDPSKIQFMHTQNILSMNYLERGHT
jgi:hypothetical protein